MSARYGAKTRSGEPVPGWGQRVVATGGTQSMYEETFTAPGTWTWPGNITHVEVLLVGGGGGAGCDDAPPAPTGYSGGGGGGGVRMEYDIAVSAPVPVTVGAGGTGGTYPGGAGSVGGDSTFGPLTVGGGGGGGAGNVASPGPSTNAPPIGGGGGALGAGSATGAGFYTQGGEYGMPNITRGQTPTVPNSYRGRGAGSLTAGTGNWGGFGRYSYGVGGSDGDLYNATMVESYGKNATSPFGANTGMGGAPNPGAGTSPGEAGSGGVVIVRWWE